MLHKGKIQERELLEQRFLQAHKGNKRKDGPFSTLAEQEKDSMLVAALQSKKISEREEANDK